jgi:hypothetical protein
LMNGALRFFRINSATIPQLVIYSWGNLNRFQTIGSFTIHNSALLLASYCNESL